MDCSVACKCGTRAKPCKNKKAAANYEGESRGKPTNSKVRRMNQQGFRLTHEPRETEEIQREKENKDVKDFVATLDEDMVRKLAIRSLRRGIGSMDIFIHCLLWMMILWKRMKTWVNLEHSLKRKLSNQILLICLKTNPLHKGQIGANVDIVNPCHKKSKIDVVN
ncbi:uncharacterized protein LOC114536636 isoform X2 [Dendronephthya gigantea]|nr:uncharacterized protein LOC114536636 isoform X2 [Dendronephthya gigantea]